VSTRTLPLTTIQPSGSWVPLRLTEIWEYRELLYFLIWRDVKIRYKQTALGAAWAVLQPLLTMVVFSVVFGRFAGLPSDGIPYPVFTYSALLPWQLFAFALGESSNSLVAHQRLISKVYFPRLIIPLSAIGVGLVDFFVSLVVLFGLMAYYGIAPTFALWTAPLWALLAVSSALGVGLWLSALNVKYRDVRYTLPFLTQIWMFASPVAYASSLVPETWRPIYSLNPMVGVIDGFRWALLGAANPPLVTVLVSVGAVCVLLLTGLIYFRRTERYFADLI
jgi:homopolymeric O-antigen transport system permease protein